MESGNQFQAKEFGEREAGVQEYISAENTVIQCAIKHRFSDFIVNEIDEHGTVVWFAPETDLQKWKKVNEVPKYLEDHGGEEENKEGYDFGATEEWLDKLKQLLSGEEYQKFSDFLQDLKEGSIEKTSVYTFESHIEDKGLRSQIHQHFKSTNTFETDTFQEGEIRKIRVFLKNALSANKRRKLNIVVRKDPEEKNMPQYLMIVVQKTNIDTMQAVHYIAKKLKKFGKSFQIAGNKDKRGITTQRITILRGSPEMLIRFQRAKDWDNKIKVGSFERVEKALRLGQLSGNRFSVALRFIPKEITNEQIAKNVENLKEHGFINYFGMQRFGTYNVRTHEIGKEALNQNWQKVIQMILSQHPDGDQDSYHRKQKMLKYVFEEYDINSALDLIERRDRLEKSVLLVLKRTPNGYYNAFQNIARNTRTIYIHAYQSYVWNRSVSERLRKFGHQVLIGDLAVEPEKSKIVEEADMADDIPVDQDEEVETAEQIVLEDNEEEEKNGGRKSKVEKSGKNKIDDVLIEVTAENIKNFSLKDIVMPLFGFKTRMPNNEDLKKIINDIMAEDEITIEKFEKQALLDATSAWGSYRKILGYATDIQYDITEFQNTNEDLLTPNYLEEQDPTPNIDMEDKDKVTYKALRLKFSLKQSSYATMLLREVTKMSSAYNVQSGFSRDMNAA